MKMTINPDTARKKKTSDSFVLTTDGRLAAVASRAEDGNSFTCYGILTEPYQPQDYDLLPWDLVGVHR